MKYLPKIFSILLVALLLTVNFNMDYSLNPIDVQVNMDLNTAQAETFVYDYKMVEETCWVDGRPINKCHFYPSWYCNLGEQDTCSTQE